jgi:aryl sulfotransferase
MTLDAFVARYLADGCIGDFEPDVVRWDRMVTEWVALARMHSVMIVRYEELHGDRHGLLGRIGSFCGLDPSAHALEAAVGRGSLESMRQEERLHGVEPQHPPDPPSRGWFFRQGRTDGWRSELSAESLAAVERAFGPAMAAVGYSPAS